MRRHIPEEAARLIAEEMQTQSDIATKLDALATKEQLEQLRSSIFRWLLVFFLPIWAGTWGTLVAILVRG